MSTGREHLLPGEICQAWEERLAPLPGAHRDALMVLIGTYLPPASGPALRACHRYFDADHASSHALDIDVLNTALTQLGLPRENPRAYKVHHPLYAAVTGTFSPLSHPGHRAARLVMTGLFARSTGSNAGLYYSQLLTVRRCLALVTEEVNGDYDHWRSAADAFRDALIANKANPGLGPNVAERLARLQQFRELINGAREIGVNRVSRPTGTRRSRPADPQVDLRLEERLTQAAPPPSPAARERALEREEARVDATSTRIGGAVYSPTPPPSRAAGDEPADPDTAEHVQRQTASALTPADDHALLRQGPAMAATSTLIAHTDPGRLPLGRIHEALEVISDCGAQWAFTWLILTTGMPPERLARLRACPQATEREEPHWHNDTLTYRVLDGPVAVGNGDNQCITLTLPVGITQALADLAASTPFAALHKRIDQRLKRALRNTPGMLPTVRRLRASAELQLLPEARDSVAARALTGHYSLAYAAPAAYRAYPPGELQALFASTSTTLAQSLLARAAPTPALAQRLEAVCAFPQATPHASGSGRALAPAELKPLFLGLRDAGARLGEQFTQYRGPERAWAEALVQVVRVQAAYTYLAWALATGARPVARKTVFVWADKGVHAQHQAGAYLSDKASGAYRERRLVPVIQPLAQQLHRNREACNTAEQLLLRRRWSVRDPRGTDQKALPAHLVRTTKRTTEWRVFRQRDLAATLEETGIGTGATFAANATRHTVASQLRQTVPEAQVDALLGHARAGRGVFAPASTGTMDWAGLRAALETLLQDAGFRVARIEALFDVR